MKIKPTCIVGNKYKGVKKMESIPINKIICESNRKYTKDEGIDQLANSIKQYGIIQAPTVRRMDEDQYKIIAGRRRIEAARRLKMSFVDCVVREESNPVEIDEEIALTENVNRQDMHPLDEAGAFKRMFDAGTPIEEIAQYYARSPSAIYKRLRLCGLVEELKSMLRDGVINISGAAILAELPDENQYEFYEQNKDKHTTLVEEGYNIDINLITTFINKKQLYVIKKCMNNCEGCNKRTHNEGNELFEECNDLKDVCLDPDCYRIKWYEMLAARLEEQKIQFVEAGLQTDEKIVFFGGIPEMLYKKASFVNIIDNKKQNIKYEILRSKDYDFTEETNRKKNTCWEVCIGNKDNDYGIIVKRVGYKVRPPREKYKPEKGGYSYSSTSKDIKEYGLEVIESIASDRGITPMELVDKIHDKIFHYEFKNDIADLIREKIITKRIEDEKEGIELPRDYLSMFLRAADDEVGSCTFIEKDFSQEQKKWYHDLLGDKNIKKISIGLNDEAQKLFHIFLLSIGIGDAPDLDDLKDINNEKNLFWEYAAITKDEYRAMYLEASNEVTDKVFPKEKPNKTRVNTTNEEKN